MTKTFSDIVIFEDFDAVRKELYNTQLNQMIKPIMLSLSKETRFRALPEINSKNPGLHLRSVNKKFISIKTYKKYILFKVKHLPGLFEIPLQVK